MFLVVYIIIYIYYLIEADNFANEKNYFLQENFPYDLEDGRFKPDTKFSPMEFKQTEEYSITLKNMEDGSEGTKSKNTFMSVEPEVKKCFNFFIRIFI